MTKHFATVGVAMNSISDENHFVAKNNHTKIGLSFQSFGDEIKIRR